MYSYFFLQMKIELGTFLFFRIGLLKKLKPGITHDHLIGWFKTFRGYIQNWISLMTRFTIEKDKNLWTVKWELDDYSQFIDFKIKRKGFNYWCFSVIWLATIQTVSLIFEKRGGGRGVLFLFLVPAEGSNPSWSYPYPLLSLRDISNLNLT